MMTILRYKLSIGHAARGPQSNEMPQKTADQYMGTPDHSHVSEDLPFNDESMFNRPDYGPQGRNLEPNIVEDNATRGALLGTNQDDHIIHHREPGPIDHSGTSLVGFNGNDTLEASVPTSGQIHMYGARGDDTFILDVKKSADAVGMQGHHAYGGHGSDTFIFQNVSQADAPIVGRLDDFDPSIDKIKIGEEIIDLEDLPRTIQLENGEEAYVRVISISHPEYESENLGEQFFLAIGDNVFYALDGARDLQNGISDLVGEERHFLLPSALDELRAAEAVQYFNPTNYVPEDFLKGFNGQIELVWTPPGSEVNIDSSSDEPAHVFAGKTNKDADSSRGEQVINGSNNSDIIDANTGNDTVYGGDGDDLIAGGIDNDSLDGGTGSDVIWGGDGDDTILGRGGDDLLVGGRGDDLINGGWGSDVIVAGLGDDTLTGGGGDSDVNRFHFAFDSGHTLITDFKVGLDKISIQHEIDPLSVEILESDDGNVIVNYGQEASIELQGVSLADFQAAAEIRASENDPLLVISTDPEDELAQQILVENGFYGDASPPALEIEGLQYGASAFDSGEPGGYFYARSLEDGSEPDPEPGGDPIEDLWLAPTVPSMSDDEEDEEEAEETERDGEAQSGSSSCFVATAAYQDPWHPEVVYLRRFRDEWLVERIWGRAFIDFYWRVGPVLAIPVRKSTILQELSKGLIRILIRLFKLKVK
ncbi:calcium-binding protein [Roseibaca sp. Y0-43]|uniref:calcium-binding protein n=1 Tax=Roseibaca sp. Y0-43 TaxID=2816854 RepID=UPI001D0C2058|nr:calcium-binding protein [Roseibaca sp. Y0-43]MCC1482847.1 hypothetical protein [Roseibaca sp. Y0-43]